MDKINFFTNMDWTCPSCEKVYPITKSECDNPYCPSKFETRTGTGLSPFDENNILLSLE